MNQLQMFVNSISISSDVFGLRPDCKVLVIAIDNVVNGKSDEASLKWLDDACRTAQTSDHQPHLDAWRDAYRAFGAKPQKFRPSFMRCCVVPLLDCHRSIELSMLTMRLASNMDFRWAVKISTDMREH